MMDALFRGTKAEEIIDVYGNQSLGNFWLPFFVKENQDRGTVIILAKMEQGFLWKRQKRSTDSHLLRICYSYYTKYFEIITGAIMNADDYIGRV